MERVIQSVVLEKKLHSGGHSVTSNGLKKILFHPCLIVDQPAAATAARITTIAVNRGRRAGDERALQQQLGGVRLCQSGQ